MGGILPLTGKTQRTVRGTDSDHNIPGDLVYSVEGADNRICAVPTKVCHEGDWTWSQAGETKGNDAHKFYPGRIMKMPQKCRSRLGRRRGWKRTDKDRGKSVTMNAEECRQCLEGKWEGGYVFLPRTAANMHDKEPPKEFVPAKGKFCDKCECGGGLTAEFTDEENEKKATGESAPSQTMSDHWKWVSTDIRGQAGKWINCDAMGTSSLSPEQDYDKWMKDGKKYKSMYDK